MHVRYAYAYLPPTPEVWELWKDGKALGPEYLLSPDGEAELKSETSLSALRLHVLYALASTETLNRIPNCSWLNREASLLRQLSQQVLTSLTLSSLYSLASPSSPSSSSSSSSPLEFSAFHPETNLLREEFSPRFLHGYSHLPHLSRSIPKARVMVENLDQFHWNFQVFTQGILTGNTSVVVSGSTVLACMYMGADKQCYAREAKLREDFATLALPRDIALLVASYAFHPDPLMPYSSELYNALFCTYHLELEWQTCDIDVFLQVKDVAEAELTLQKIMEGYRASLPPEVEDFGVIRTQTSVTLCSRWPFRNLQIVLVLFPSVSGLLSCFDLDCVRMAYVCDSRSVVALPQAARALSTGVNLISPSLCMAWGRSTSFRIEKYQTRGFHAALFDLWPLEKNVSDWLELVDSGSVSAFGKSFTPFNTSAILMPSLSYPVNSLFPGQRLRSPSTSKPLPSPESRCRFSFSSTGSLTARRNSGGSEDSVSFHVGSESPCPSPPLKPLPSVFTPPRSAQSSPRRSPPPSMYGGGSPTSMYGGMYPPNSPYHGFRPSIFNLAFPPRFSPPLTPQAFSPYAGPMPLPQRPPFVYPPLSPFSAPLYPHEQLSPLTPAHLSSYSPRPPAVTPPLNQITNPSFSAMSSPAHTVAESPGVSSLPDPSETDSPRGLGGALGSLVISAEKPESLDPRGEEKQTSSEIPPNSSATSTSPKLEAPTTPSTAPQIGQKVSPVGSNFTSHVQYFAGSISSDPRASLDSESKYAISPHKDTRDLSLGERCVLMAAAFRQLFHVQLHPQVLPRILAAESSFRTISPLMDSFNLELPLASGDINWNSELKKLPYGPGLNTAESIPSYVTHLKDISVPVMASTALAGIWNGKEALNADTSCLLWFRWKASEYDEELVKSVLEKNI